jgi:hypothetical protein
MPGHPGPPAWPAGGGGRQQFLFEEQPTPSTVAPSTSIASVVFIFILFFLSCFCLLNQPQPCPSPDGNFSRMGLNFQGVNLESNRCHRRTLQAGISQSTFGSAPAAQCSAQQTDQQCKKSASGGAGKMVCSLGGDGIGADFGFLPGGGFEVVHFRLEFSSSVGDFCGTGSRHQWWSLHPQRSFPYKPSGR